MDRDVGGVAALAASPGLRMSVLVWALPLAACAYLALGSFLAAGSIGFLAVALPISGVLGYLLALGGSTAKTAIGFLWSVSGSALLFLVVLCVASLPGGVVARRSRAAPGNAQPRD